MGRIWRPGKGVVIAVHADDPLALFRTNTFYSKNRAPD
jgi:hypothetical protein